MFFNSTICIFVSLILLFLLLSSFIYFKIHTHCFIVNNEKLKTSFLLMRVLAIAIIDGSANCSVIIGRDELFLCYRFHNPVSGDQSIGIFFKDAFLYVFDFFFVCSSSVSFYFIHTAHPATRIDICFPLTVVTSICPLYTMLPATRKKEALFLFILYGMKTLHVFYNVIIFCDL